MKQLFQDVLTSLSSIIQPRFFEKGELLLDEYKVCNDLFLVRHGLLRSYYYVEGKDITAHFAMEYGIVGAADSIIKGKKSRYHIEALETSEVYMMDYAAMESFLEKNPKHERLARRFTQLLYMDLVERLEGMMFLSASQRYEYLLGRYPEITQRVNLGHIATYLGITQETLSRVRAQH